MADYLGMAISNNVQQQAALREELRGESGANPSADRRAKIRSELKQLREREGQLRWGYERQWEAAHAAAPRQIRIDGRTGTLHVLTAAMGGGRSRAYTTDHPEYEAVLAEYQRGREIDRLAAEAAFAAWGWRGPVRIDQFERGEIRVSGGGRTHTTTAAALTVARR